MTETWDDVPAILRNNLEGALSFSERIISDYSQCVTEKEIATRRFKKNDPEAWAKTVQVLVSLAINYGSMLRTASEMGMPGAAEKLDDKITVQ